MTVPSSLNRRHKFCLLITLLMAGFLLLVGELSAGLGTLLLGLASTWVIGSPVVLNAGRKAGPPMLGMITFASWLGLMDGLIIEPFMRAIGHPIKGPQPSWFTEPCALVLPLGIGLAWLLDRLEHRKPEAEL